MRVERLFKTVRGPLATVRVCEICGYSNRVPVGTPGVGRGYGMREGNKARGDMIRHIREAHFGKGDEKLPGLDDALEIVSSKRWNGTAKQIEEESGGRPTADYISKYASRLIVNKSAFNGRAMLVRAGWRTEMRKIATEARDGGKA